MMGVRRGQLAMRKWGNRLMRRFGEKLGIRTGGKWRIGKLIWTGGGE